MRPPARTFVALVITSATARSEPLRLPTLGVELEGAPGWRLEPATGDSDSVTVGGGATITLSARPGAVCPPAAAADRVPSCPADLTCTVAPRGVTGRIGYCAAVPGGVFEASTTTEALAQPALAADVNLVVRRAWEAIVQQRTATPWVRRAPVSGLELAIRGDASWAFVPDHRRLAPLTARGWRDERAGPPIGSAVARGLAGVSAGRDPAARRSAAARAARPRTRAPRRARPRARGPARA